MGMYDIFCDFCPGCSKALYEQSKVFREPTLSHYQCSDAVPSLLDLGPPSYSVELSDCSSCQSPLFANIVEEVFSGLSSVPFNEIIYSDKMRRREMGAIMDRQAFLHRLHSRIEVAAPAKVSFAAWLLSLIPR